jgi:tetratricopeptide (TPR) repeat protein
VGVRPRCSHDSIEPLLLLDCFFTICGMGYLLRSATDDTFIEQEFDQLDWRLRRGESAEVQGACEAILNSLDISRRRGSWARLLLASVAVLRGAYTEALAHCEAIQDLPAALRPRATAVGCKARGLSGEREAAISDLSRLVAEAPQSFHAWEALGSVQRAAGRSGEAWEALRAALAIRPGDREVMSALVAIGMPVQRYRELKEALVLHLGVEPMDLNIRMALASCLVCLGDLVAAQEEMRRIVAFAPFSVVDPAVVATAQEMLIKTAKI